METSHAMSPYDQQTDYLHGLTSFHGDTE